MPYTKQTLSYFAAVLVALLFTAQACDTTSVDDHDEHAKPFGVTMFMDGVEIATQESEETTYRDGDHLELEIGEETNLIQVRWIAEDGDRFTPDGDDYSLQWNIADESVLEIEQHEEDGKWNFHLVGAGVGETTFTLELWHDNHADFTSQPFEIHVEEVVSGMEVRNDAGESVVTVDHNGEVTGTFEVSSAETEGPFTAVFLDEDGSEIDTDHHYELEWHLHGSDYANVSHIDGEPFSFNIEGLSTGQAEVHFELIKEDEGHDDGDDHDHDDEIGVYESPDIFINVN